MGIASDQTDNLSMTVNRWVKPFVDGRGPTFPYVPGGHEAEGGLHAWVGGTVWVVENLQAEVPGYQGS
jgi:hypothetical protein